MPEHRTLYEPSTEHDACGFGFVCDIAGRPSHGIVRDALTVLVNLEHRGASGSERNTGDGAGILTGIPHAFLRRGGPRRPAWTCPRAAATAWRWSSCRVTRPAGTATVAFLERILADEGLVLLGWREVPTDPMGLGESASASRPVIRQAFIARPPGLPRAVRPGTSTSSAACTSPAGSSRRPSSGARTRAAASSTSRP